MPTTKKANRSLLIRVPDVLYRSLARRAEAHNLSMAELAREAIMYGLPQAVLQRQKQEKTLQAMLDETVCRRCGEGLRNGNCLSCSGLVTYSGAQETA